MFPNPENTGASRHQTFTPSTPLGPNNVGLPSGAMLGGTLSLLLSQFLGQPSGSSGTPALQGSGPGQNTGQNLGFGLGLPDGSGGASGTFMNQVLQNLAQLGVFEGTGGNVGGTGGNSAVLQQLINSMATAHDLPGSGDPRASYGGASQPSFIGGGDATRAVLMEQGLQYLAQQLQQQAESHDMGDPIKGGPHGGWGDDPTQQQGMSRQDRIAGVEDPDAIAAEQAQQAAAADKAKAYWGFVGGASAGAIVVTLIKGWGSPMSGLLVVVVAGLLGAALASKKFPAPDDDGGGGPRANYYIPDPEGNSGGGPRSFVAMPDPETGSGGGPRGIDYFPDPESTGGNGPRASGSRSGK